MRGSKFQIPNSKFRFILVFLLILAWLFSGWPRIWQKHQIPPEVPEAKAAEDAWFNTGYKYRKKLTLDNTLVSGSTDFTNFPVLISYTDTDLVQDSDCAAGSPAISGPCNASGFDIIFTDSNASTPVQLDHEIEKYTAASGLIVMWVEVSTLGATVDTDIYIYYGNSSISSSQEAVTGTWETNYKGVWHLKEDPTGAAPQMKDSTSNANHGTADQGPTQTAGVIGDALNYDGTNDCVAIGDPANGSLDFGTGSVAFSVWVYVSSSAGAFDSPWFKGGASASVAGYVMLLGTGAWSVAMSDGNGSGNPVATNGDETLNQWVFMAGVVNRTTNQIVLYKNGTAGTGVSISAEGSIDTTSGARIGNCASLFFKGKIDETRVYSGVLSGDWLTTEYNNINNQSTGAGKFIKTLGGEESTITSTASVATRWIKGGATSQSVTFTVNNAAGSGGTIQWVRFTRPSASYTISAGSATGWTAATAASTATFTGSTIAIDGLGTFTVTFDTASTDEALTAWTVDADDDSGGGSTVSSTATSTGALNTGIDSTAPTGASISSVTVDSNTQITVVAAAASDASAGLHSSGPYWFDETTGASGATDSTDWQTSTSFVDTGLAGGTRYCYRVKVRDGVANESAFSDSSCKTTTGGASPSPSPTANVVPADRTPPAVSNLNIQATHATATITWITDEHALTYIEYGTTTAYGLQTPQNKDLLKDHKTVIGGLKPATKYNFRIISEDTLNNIGKSSNSIFFTDEELLTPEAKEERRKEEEKRRELEQKFEEEERKLKEPATPPPLLSNVAVTRTLPTSARITWETDVPATTQVLFGISSGELTRSTVVFATLVTSHNIIVSDLTPETTYYFTAVSRNVDETEGRSEEKTFRTPSLEVQTILDVSKPLPLAPGSPGTQVPFTGVGETVTAVPILATGGDSTPPEVSLFRFSENPTENTSPAIRGRAIDRQGVIAGIAYSTDGGISWHPITDVEGIGSSAASFSAKIPNLRDGNYPILFRVRDNSQNYGKSETKVLVVDIRPPATGANMVLLGSQSLIPSAAGAISTLAGIVQRVITTAIGGAISVEVIAEKLTPDGTASTTDEVYTQPLILSRAEDLWFGDIQINKQGVYQLKLRAEDGAGRVSERSVNLLHAAEAGKVTDARRKAPLELAKVSVFEFKNNLNDFVLWPGEVFGQANPYYTQEDGTYRFIVPPGRYYLKIEKEGYKTFYTNIMDFDSHRTLNLLAPLYPESSFPIRLPVLGEYQFTLPSPPDIFGSRRISSPVQAELIPEPFAKMIGKPAPLFSLPDNTGTKVDIRYLRGKKTILSAWSTWSPLAQAQIPILDEIHRNEEAETDVLLLSLHESDGIIDAYLKRGGYELTSVIDRDGKLTDIYPIYTLPHHFFLDRKGIVQEVYSGFLDAKKLLQKLEGIP